MFNKALKYLENNRPEKAVPLFKKCLKEFEFKEAYLNLGNCYRKLDRDSEAINCYLKASDPLVPLSDKTFVPEYDVALNNMGLVAYTYGNDDEAIKFYTRALAINPQYHDASWNASCAMLRKLCSRDKVNARLAWELYGSRFSQNSKSRTNIKNTKKDLISWKIDSGKVKSLVVLGEQGLGDILMYARYIPLLEDYADKIIVQANPRMASLFKYETCEDPVDTDATHGVPIGDLAKIFFSEIPAGDWLKDKYVKKEKNGTLDIGCVWSGSPTHTNDRHRSTNYRRFLAFNKYGTLHNLNPGAKAPGFINCTFKDWEENIAYMSKLDLVICVDTSVAHLCGALGMECWVIMQFKETDFRWGNSSMGFDNVWYDSVKVIRNNQNWDDSFKMIDMMLKEYVNSK